MKYIIALLFFLIFPYQANAKKWKTVFPTEQEIIKMDKSYIDKKVVVQNFYYPKHGKYSQVLSIRIAASKLLKEFGLQPGQVMITRMTTDTAKGKQDPQCGAR